MSLSIRAALAAALLSAAPAAAQTVPNPVLYLTGTEHYSAGGKQWVRWQRCEGALSYTAKPAAIRPLTSSGAVIANGTEIYNTDRTTTSSAPSSEAKASLTSVGSGTNVISAGAGTAVMVVEVAYNYQPVIPNSFLAGRRITYVSAFNVRQRTDQTLRNVNRITPKSCNLFAA